MSNGVRYQGRFIPPEAYAAYTIGIEHELRGAYQDALTWYDEALAEDPESTEIWARIGACQCLGVSATHGPAAATRAFENGIQREPQYYGNYFERARCEERAQSLGPALRDAKDAVARRPEDEPANWLVAQVLQAQGHPADARAWLEAFQVFLARGPRMRSEREAARAERSTEEERAGSPLEKAHSAAFVDLRHGQLEHARRRAQTDLEADPTNADAWIASLVACDALRDEVCFAHALPLLRSPPLAPSKTGLQFLTELISRRTGAQLSTAP